jgi:hypothetical protein
MELWAPALLHWQAKFLQLDIEADPVGDHLERRDIALAPLLAGQQPDHLRGWLASGGADGRWRGNAAVLEMNVDRVPQANGLQPLVLVILRRGPRYVPVLLRYGPGWWPAHHHRGRFVCGNAVCRKRGSGCHSSELSWPAKLLGQSRGQVRPASTHRSCPASGPAGRPCTQDMSARVGGRVGDTLSPSGQAERLRYRKTACRPTKRRGR